MRHAFCGVIDTSRIGSHRLSAASNLCNFGQNEANLPQLCMSPHQFRGCPRKSSSFQIFSTPLPGQGIEQGTCNGIWSSTPRIVVRTESERIRCAHGRCFYTGICTHKSPPEGHHPNGALIQQDESRFFFWRSEIDPMAVVSKLTVIVNSIVVRDEITG